MSKQKLSTRCHNGLRTGSRVGRVNYRLHEQLVRILAAAGYMQELPTGAKLPVVRTDRIEWDQVFLGVELFHALRRCFLIRGVRSCPKPRKAAELIFHLRACFVLGSG